MLLPFLSGSNSPAVGVVTHFDVAPPFRAALAGLNPAATKQKCVTTAVSLCFGECSVAGHNGDDRAQLGRCT